MKYRSTRSGETVTAAEALLRGLAADGGLYLPEALPAPFLSYDALQDLSYQELAVQVLRPFFEEIPEEKLAEFVQKAYGPTFSTPEIVPVRSLSRAVSMAELFHGRTCAFKDLALSLFPYLLTWAKQELGEERQVLILTATSGDTGKAALEGFRDVEGTSICVFYPSDGVSPLQKDQMQKQEGANVRVCGIRGNFDDAQSAVKALFTASLTPEEGGDAVLFSSANSINIGRLFPQVVYYVWTWLSLVRNGSIGKTESFNVVVPTGNFGNILAAWIARQLGTPIDKLVCASNENHVLSDFFATGTYDRRRPFHLTNSPSMDILISSNFERFLWYMAGEEETAAAMKALKEEGAYTMPPAVMDRIGRDMCAGWADDEAAAKASAAVYESYDYLMDPHTAVAYEVYNALRRRGQIPRGSHTVVMSTAHPYKFPDASAEAIQVAAEGSPYDKLRTLAEATGIPLPPQLARLENAPVRFPEVVEKNAIADYVKALAAQIRKERGQP